MTYRPTNRVTPTAIATRYRQPSPVGHGSRNDNPSAEDHKCCSDECQNCHDPPVRHTSAVAGTGKELDGEAAGECFPLPPYSAALEVTGDDEGRASLILGGRKLCVSPWRRTRSDCEKPSWEIA